MVTEEGDSPIFAAKKLGQSPARKPVQSPPGDIAFELSADGAAENRSPPGLIGPTGDCTNRLLDDMWDDVPPGSDVEYLLGPGGGRAAPMAGQVGPVRRCLGSLVGHRFAAAGAAGAPGPPLVGQPWQFRPYSFGMFFGGLSGSPLVDGWVEQGSGFIAGYRAAMDWDCYWGLQTRVAFGSSELNDPLADGLQNDRTSDLVLWDIGLVIYPWGDTNFRPYLLAGVGAARIDFTDRLDVRWADTVFEVPLGVGVKYRWCDRLALRIDVTDNVVIGGQFDTIHDLSFTGGVEVLFGGPRVAYWPWNPGRHYW